MSQNLTSLRFTPEDLAAIDAALNALEEKLIGLVSLQPSEVRTLNKMGARSEWYCRETLVILEQNPQIVPPALDLQEAKADLAALDALRPRLARLNQLRKRGSDTLMVLGSDLDAVQREGYALIRVSGTGSGLEELHRGLSGRFAKRRKVKPEEPKS